MIIVHVAVMGSATQQVPSENPMTAQQFIDAAGLGNQASGKQLKVKIGNGDLTNIAPDFTIRENAYLLISKEAKGA